MAARLYASRAERATDPVIVLGPFVLFNKITGGRPAQAPTL
jgi:hypothetical protein